MMTAKWQLLLRKDRNDVVIQNFPTRREAQEEIENRRSLTVHLGTNPEEVYHVKRTGRQRHPVRGLQNKRS